MVTADGNLTAKDALVFNVIQPRLDLTFTGPKLRYLDRQAAYMLKVTNPCSAAMTNVMLIEQIPPGFKFVEATEDGRHDAANRTVTWTVGELAANQSREVSVKVIAASLGTFTHKANVISARGTKTEAEVATQRRGSGHTCHGPDRNTRSHRGGRGHGL